VSVQFGGKPLEVEKGKAAIAVAAKEISRKASNI
jgi:hypothetical protein